MKRMDQSSGNEKTTLYLVRHGATDANEQRPYVLQGSGIDLSLSANGREQAAAVGRLLSGRTVHHVYSSSLVRAMETAETIADHHGHQVRPIEQLVECDVGQWEGMDWDSIMREHAQAYQALMEDPATNPYLGGESYGDVLQRAEPAIEELLRRHVGESIVVVAHNVVNRVYLAHLLDLDLRRAKDIHQSNACVNVIRYRDGRTELMTLNATFHLADCEP